MDEIETGKQQRKPNETKSGFFEQSNKIDKPLARLAEIKREKTKFTNIRNEKGDIAIDPAAVKRIIWKYYKQLYACTNKSHNLEEIDRLLKKHKEPEEYCD